jgi:ribosome-binding factor A
MWNTAVDAFLVLSERIRTMPNPHRQEKLGELIAAELSELLRTRIKDPRVGFASITHVEVSGDLRHAKVFVSVMGSAEERVETMKGLKNATGFLRHELATRLVLRYMPELAFKLDNSIEEGARILALINKVEQEERTQAGSSEVE